MFTRMCVLGLVMMSAFVEEEARARDRGQFKDTSEQIKGWFKSLRSPKGAVPCCDEADGHRTEYQVRGDRYWVPIEGKWYAIPPEIIVRDRGNPTGEGVVFYYMVGEVAPIFFCFVPDDTN
jgi:hypothetical protein